MITDKSVSILFPSPRPVPGGGPKVVYEYANRLVNNGWKVNIVYKWSIRTQIIMDKRRPLRSFFGFFLYNVPYLIKRFFKIYPTCRSWFALDEKVSEHFLNSIDYNSMPHTAFYMATACSTAPIVSQYPVENGRKLYLIQGYEKWQGRTDRMVRDTYHLGLKNIVVSRWLKAILDEEKVESTLMLNGFDFDSFSQSISFENKDKMYATALHGGAIKGSKYAIEACKIVRQKYPSFRLRLFGVFPKPKNLPEWVEYYRNPDKATLNYIYNDSAFYLGTSLQEGWGLTIGESMICGAAVVCTDILGYREMVSHGETGLMSPVADSNAMAQNIIRLIEDDNLRYEIASKGNHNIMTYTWDNSFNVLQSLLESN